MDNLNSPVIVLAGFSAVGKTTLGGIYSELYGLDYIDHQKLVHQLAEQKGYERARYWLADVGTVHFVRESVHEMVTRISSSKNDVGILIDASYGEFMIQLLKESFPQRRIVIVSVEAGEEVREMRMMGRMGAERGVAIQELKFRDRFLRGVGVEGTMLNADITVHNTRELDQTINSLSGELERIGVTFPRMI